MCSISLPEILEMVRELDLGPEDSEGFRVGVVLLTSAFKGTNADMLAKYTGYDRREVRKWSKRFRDNGIWEGHRVCAEWSDEKYGVVAFVLDVCVGQGLVERSLE